jgi:two-component system nitrogen regulation sensor histidine kinase NtrY
MAAGRRTVRWVAVVVLLVIAVWVIYALITKLAAMGPDLDLNQLLLPALSLTAVVLALALAGVLIRNLVRLIVDRKRGILGARLRTKLVFFFLALVLLPATILFYGSAQVINETVEAILRTPLENISSQSREIVDEWNEYFQDQSHRRARLIAGEIEHWNLLEPERGPQLEGLLGQWREQDDMQLVWIVSGARIIAQAGGPFERIADEQREQLRSTITGLVLRITQRREPIRGISYLGDGLLAHAAVPVEHPAVEGGHHEGIVAVGIALPTRLASSLGEIDKAAGAYRKFRAQRRELVRLYLTLIGLIFLVTLFIATWIGLYVSRRITVPIQELADASREISAGNLEVRVGSDPGDELGMLVEAFNEMAGELQENREVISRSTADLRRSNRAADERRRYIETLLANISTAVISLDSFGLVTTANPAVREILGIELDPGQEAGRVFREEGLTPLVEFMKRSEASRGAEQRRDLTLERESGILNVSMQISPLRGASGEDLGTLIMVEDLTELLRAQKEAAWHEVARRIAHEIKNPLTPIQLSAQRLRKKFAEGSADLGTVLPEAMASIEREVGALKELVDEFSSFARMPEVAAREVDFAHVVESVLALYKSHPDIEWEVQVEEEVGSVSVDPEQIRRALINLVDNAVTAMEGKGTVRITASLPEGDGKLRVEIADTGPGMPLHDRERIFSPDFTTKGRGAGLGLAIVHKVVTDHQGTIRVEENSPRGVCFVIELPA